MRKFVKLFTFAVITTPFITGGAFSATCSQLSLTKCLDSACAINIGANPAARCQLCGTSSAGTADTKSGMTQLSIGASSKTTITDKELKSAPIDPGQRYAWATEQCITKNSGCTADDVTETYDKLIEQSCTAAGVDSQMLSAQSVASKEKSSTTCESEIKLCLIDDAKCNSDYSNCANDSSFNNFFSACASAAGKCGNYTTEIRTNLISERDSAVKNADALLTKITTAYQNARDKKLNDAKSACTDNAARNSCVKTVCATNMENGCAVGFEDETSMATLLCNFYVKACENINKK